MASCSFSSELCKSPQRVLFSRLMLSTDKDRQLVLLPCVLSFRLMWCNHSHWYTLRGQAVKFWMAHLPRQSLKKSKPLYLFICLFIVGGSKYVSKSQIKWISVSRWKNVLQVYYSSICFIKRFICISSVNCIAVQWQLQTPLASIQVMRKISLEHNLTISSQSIIVQFKYIYYSVNKGKDITCMESWMSSKILSPVRRHLGKRLQFRQDDSRLHFLEKKTPLER